MHQMSVHLLQVDAHLVSSEAMGQALCAELASRLGSGKPVAPEPPATRRLDQVRQGPGLPEGWPHQAVMARVSGVSSLWPARTAEGMMAVQHPPTRVPMTRSSSIPPLPKAVGLGQDDGKALTDAYARQQAVDAPGGIGSRATLVVDHSTFEVKITAEQVGQSTPGSHLFHTVSPYLAGRLGRPTF